MKIIKDTSDPVVYRMKKRDEMREQLATVIGVVVFILNVLFMGAGLRLYRKIAVSLGIWSEPTLIDALLWGYALFFAAALMGAVVRWLLVYKWVAMKEG